jgi:hypothetical protein
VVLFNNVNYWMIVCLSFVVIDIFLVLLQRTYISSRRKRLSNRTSLVGTSRISKQWRSYWIIHGSKSIVINRYSIECQFEYPTFRHWAYSHYLMKNHVFQKQTMNHWYKSFTVIAKLIHDTYDHEAMKQHLAFIIMPEK